MTQCLLMLQRIGTSAGKNLTTAGILDLPAVPRQGEFLTLNDGGMIMRYRVVGVVYTPNETNRAVDLLLTEVPASRHLSPADFMNAVIDGDASRI